MLYVCTTYFVILCLVIVVYAIIAGRFRQARKKLKALEKQSGEKYCKVKKPIFQRCFGIIAETKKNEIAGITDEVISTTLFKNESHEFTCHDLDRPRKRRSSSVVKSFSV